MFLILLVPLVSRVLPSDLCQIHKKGTSFRLDTTLVDFAMNDMKWERGEITFLFDGDAKPPHSLIVMDNKAGVYQRVRYLVRKSIFYINLSNVKNINTAIKLNFKGN